MRNFFYKSMKCLTAIYTAAVLLLAVELIISEVPDNIYVRSGEEAEIHVDFPFSITDIETESYEKEKKLCSMFGIIPVKEITVNEVEEQEVYVSGEIVGIYTKCDGVFVIDTCQIETENGIMVDPSGGQIKTGDYILSINGRALGCKEDMAQMIKESDGSSMRFVVSRNKVPIELYVTPVKAKNNNYMLGIWIKDDLAGVGTLTYVTMDGKYGALGHGMSNGENVDLLRVDGGDLYGSKVIGIEKGKKGDPGELKGVINYSSGFHMGKVIQNESTGIFGKLDKEDLQIYATEGERYPVGYKQEIKAGPATIISEISGERKSYDIYISYVDYLAINSNKGLHIQVTDPELLSLTGGIVQGMSGSPILQDDKVVGAVTHVLINDPTRGYGIFIENMLDVTP